MLVLVLVLVYAAEKYTITSPFDAKMSGKSFPFPNIESPPAHALHECITSPSVFRWA